MTILHQTEKKTFSYESKSKRDFALITKIEIFFRCRSKFQLFSYHDIQTAIP